jgi:hypothetical protein
MEGSWTETRVLLAASVWMDVDGRNAAVVSSIALESKSVTAFRKRGFFISKLLSNFAYLLFYLQNVD